MKIHENQSVFERLHQSFEKDWNSANFFHKTTSLNFSKEYVFCLNTSVVRNTDVPKFVHVSHFCGLSSHICPNCHKLKFKHFLFLSTVSFFAWFRSLLEDWCNPSNTFCFTWIITYKAEDSCYMGEKRFSKVSVADLSLI